MKNKNKHPSPPKKKNVLKEERKCVFVAKPIEEEAEEVVEKVHENVKSLEKGNFSLGMNVNNDEKTWEEEVKEMEWKQKVMDYEMKETNEEKELVKYSIGRGEDDEVLRE